MLEQVSFVFKKLAQKSSKVSRKAYSLRVPNDGHFITDPVYLIAYNHPNPIILSEGSVNAIAI